MAFLNLTLKLRCQDNFFAQQIKVCSSSLSTVAVAIISIHVCQLLPRMSSPGVTFTREMTTYGPILFRLERSLSATLSPLPFVTITNPTCHGCWRDTLDSTTRQRTTTTTTIKSTQENRKGSVSSFVLSFHTLFQMEIRKNVTSPRTSCNYRQTEAENENVNWHCRRRRRHNAL